MSGLRYMGSRIEIPLVWEYPLNCFRDLLLVVDFMIAYSQHRSNLLIARAGLAPALAPQVAKPANAATRVISW